MGEPGRYVWAWIDEPAGVLRARFFPTDLGITEDEATGAAAVVMGDRLGRDLEIRQGAGSEILIRPGHDGTVAVGGRVEHVEHRAYVP
jgi:predicted PhzF superfamily epimerase YddE/YHI9